MTNRQQEPKFKFIRQLFFLSLLRQEGKWVTAGDLKYLGEESLEIPAEYKSIPITKLLKGQMIEFYATAVMGRGRDHVKWSPVCGVSFIPRKVGNLLQDGNFFYNAAPSDEALQHF